MHKLTRASLVAVLLSITPLALAQQNAADNTGKNRRDQAGSEVTADQQKNNKSDLEITRDIRRALMRDKSLSVYAHNVKIVAQRGAVTLKGPVRTDDEKRIVEQRAAEVAGQDNVKSQIEVTPKK